MIVIVSPRARRELIEIGAWIARDNALAAERFVDRLVTAAEQLGMYPLLHPLARNGGTLRKALVSPYLIFYRVRRDEVLIVTIRHGARDNSRLR